MSARAADGVKRGLTPAEDFAIRNALAHLHERFFTSDMRVTLVVRHPTIAEAHIVCGDDDLADVVQLLRSKIDQDLARLAEWREGKRDG